MFTTPLIRRMSLACASLFVMLMFILSGCGGSKGSASGEDNGVTNGGGVITLDSIAVTPTPVTVSRGLTASFSAMGSYSDQHTADISQQVSWSIGDSAIATIDSVTGVAKGAGIGNTTVTASLSGITSSSASLSVTAATITTISIASTVTTTTLGSTVSYPATGTFTDGTVGDVSGVVTWISSDPAVATLNSTGMASTLAQGTATISASANGVISNGLTLTVTANAGPMSNAYWTYYSPTEANWTASTGFAPFGGVPNGGVIYQSAPVSSGQITGATVTVNSETAGTMSFYYSMDSGSTDSFFFSIDDVNQLLQQGTHRWTLASFPVHAGVHTYKWTFLKDTTPHWYSDAVWLSQVKIPRTPVSIAITPASPFVRPATYQKGTTLNLTALATYSDGTSFDISNLATWASSNPAVATIDSATGLATGGAVGTTDITASDNGVTSSAVLSVSDVPVVSTVKGLNQVTLSWTSVAGASSYNIYWGTAPGITSTSNKIASATSPYVHSSLATNTRYYYRISAVNALGEILSDETLGDGFGLFTDVGYMSQPRSGHNATLLASGKLLFTGGHHISGAFKTAEIFDPATRTFSPAGSFVYGFGNGACTATLLPDGKVFFFGEVSAAELYDPATGLFTIAPNNTTTGAAFSSSGHTATLLSNGKVLLAGIGNTSGTMFSNFAELYDPVAGTYTATGSLLGERKYHRATLLSSGKVLITGGSSSVGQLSSAEIYDPVTGQFTATGNMDSSYSTATRLPNGKVLVAGGLSGTAQIYDPVTGLFTTTGKMINPRASSTATLLPYGKVFFVGGTDSSSYYLTSAEIYDPITGLFSITGSLAQAVFSHTATLLNDGNVVVYGTVTGVSASLY